MSERKLIWCFKYSMYVYSANSDCENCEHFDECYEYNKQLTERIEKGETFITPVIPKTEHSSKS